MVLNLKLDELNLFNSILSSPHDILAKDVEDAESQMDVDKHDLEEAHAATTFAEETEVFDKALLAYDVPEQSITQSKWDQLVADVAEVKAINWLSMLLIK